MTLPTPLRSVLRSRLVAAPVRRASEQARRRAAALIADLRIRGASEIGAAWRARLATPAFWRPVGASVLVHAMALAGLVMLHRASLHTEEPPTIEVALTPSDPDARVGPQSGIAWGSEAEHSAIMALLEARRSAALLNEIVITSVRKPHAPHRPSPAPHEQPADPAPPAAAKAVPRPIPERLPTPDPVVAALVSQPAPARPVRSADAPVDRPSRPTAPALAPAAPALAQAAPLPVAAQADPLPVAERAPAPTPDPIGAELAAVPAPPPPAEAAPPPVQPAEPPPAAPQIAALATSAPADQGEKRYLQAVFERLRPIRDYPDLAKYHTSGRLQLAITVGRDGTVLDALVKHSSGYGFLDRAGLDLVHRASPLPALPTSFAKDSYTFEVPVSFRYD
jgi:periplasmic protein TonB